MSDLLLEIISGEIPARMQSDAVKNFASNIQANITKVFGPSSVGNILSWITPQRIGVYIESIIIDEATKAATQEIRGPKHTAPASAIEGFLAKNKLVKAQLYIVGDYYFAKPVSEAQPTDKLKQIIIETIKNFVWPKSMISGNSSLRWVRPMKSILCLLDGKVLEFNYHHINSCNKTYGHRFMAPQEIEVTSYSDYKTKLANAWVIIDPKARKDAILSQISEILAQADVSLIEDDSLLNEIVGLVEFPKVFMGEIDDKFMTLPREVLITTLKSNQRYLMTEDKLSGKLAQFYLIVANIASEDAGKTLLEGNQRVLNARLNDAMFFYEQDLKQPFESNIEKLHSLKYHNICSMYDKQLSVKNLAVKLASALSSIPTEKIERAVMLAKCDLLTNMVSEFPELQALMGYYYSIANGEDKDVAVAVRDHYKPRGPNDALPENLLASIIALADKLDSLNQLFAAGIKPSGSKDPFGLRRAAIGILRLVKCHNWSLAYDRLDIREDVQKFINDRQKALLS